MLDRLVQLSAAGRRAAIATVIRIEGSAYRGPGAKLLVEDSGDSLGSVSGGCLEADLREVALDVLRSGNPAVRLYDTGSDDSEPWGLGLGCNGTVETFVQPFTSAEARAAAAQVRELLDGDDVFAVATLVEGSVAGRALVVSEAGSSGTTGDAELDAAIVDASRLRLADRRTSTLELGQGRLFVEVHVPPSHLVVFGAGDDAMPLVAAASAAGFRVTVCDHRPAFLTGERFGNARRRFIVDEDTWDELPLGEDTFAVVMAHAIEHDQRYLADLLETPVPYIGLLGPRDRAEDLLDGAPRTARERVYAPIGLDIGAEGPEQIAVCVVAEVLAARAGRAGGHLREREDAIHAP